ncbi:hypothetical protein D9Q98_002103 [Chlorella vulgaris]|uniref:Cyclin C-terminal domain-containing protein n=1 Tax=Chlorella vulgaris TaxID=3077 RepID=A0A9D4TVQ6_CHLVU|nr:hypothetical protein D9Q98_002103 [Chlorella vulgaris]
MDAQGIPLSPAALCAVLDHHMQAESWEEADTMLAARAERGPDSSGTAGCCHLNGWSDVSLQLLARVEEAGGSPAWTCSTVCLQACAKAARWRKCVRRLRRWSGTEWQPSPASYQHLVQALCGAGQWAEAAQTYRDMLASGLEPGAELASLIVDALWCTGLAWAQAAALDLFNQATSAGWLRVLDAKMFRGLLTLDLHATHLGTGMLRMHRWLADQRRVIGNSAAPCLLDEAKRVCVVSEDLTNGTSPSAGAAVLAQNSRQAAGGPAPAGGAEGGAEQPDVRRESLSYQAVHGLDAAALRLTPYLERRRELVGAAQQLARGLGSGTAQVWHAAVVLLDRCAAAGYRSRMDALLAAACVALAAEKEGMELPTAQLAALLDAEATQREAGTQPLAALDAELQQVTAALQGDTACLSAMHCWKLFADCLGCDVESPQQMEALLGDSFSRLHLLVADPAFTSYPPSVLAAAAVYLGRKQCGVLPFWPSVLQRLTGYSESLHSEFSQALRELQQNSEYGQTMLQAVFA